jgi:hypothetical protein
MSAMSFPYVRRDYICAPGRRPLPKWVDFSNKVPALTNAGTLRRVAPLLNPPFTKKKRMSR